MVKIKLLFFYILALNALIACTSYQVKPVSKDTSWKQGLQYTMAKTQELTLKAAIYSHSTRTLRVAIETENKSKDAITINPVYFSLEGTGVKKGQVQAQNPEMKIKNIENNIFWSNHSLQSGSWNPYINFYSPPSHFFPNEPADRRRIRWNNLQQQELRRHQQLSSELQSERENKKWAIKNYFRKTTLEPKEKYSGVIEFRTPLREGTLRLSYENKDLNIDFLVSEISKK